jgi:hypothetical protein
VGHWTAVGQLVGYLRDHTQAGLLLLHKIQAIQSRIGSHFSPPQKCSSTVRDGAKVTKSCDELLTLAIAIAKGQPTCRPQISAHQSGRREQRRGLSPTLRAAHGDVRCLHGGTRGRQQGQRRRARCSWPWPRRPPSADGGRGHGQEQRARRR